MLGDLIRINWVWIEKYDKFTKYLYCLKKFVVFSYMKTGFNIITRRSSLAAISEVNPTKHYKNLSYAN